MLQTAKGQVLSIAALGLISLLFLVGLVYKTNPTTGGKLVIFAFYCSLFLTSLSIFTLIGLSIRNWWGGFLHAANLRISFRQAVMLSFLLSGSLALQARGLLYWWTEASFILLLIFIEAFMNLKI